MTEASCIASPADMDDKSVSAGADTSRIGQWGLAAEEHCISCAGEIKTYVDDTVTVAAMAKPAPCDPAPGCPNDYEALRGSTNDIIVDMKEDGTLASLQEKWFGQSFVDMLPDEAPTW